MPATLKRPVRTETAQPRRKGDKLLIIEQRGGRLDVSTVEGVRKCLVVGEFIGAQWHKGIEEDTASIETLYSKLHQVRKGWRR